MITKDRFRWSRCASMKWYAKLRPESLAPLLARAEQIHSHQTQNRPTTTTKWRLVLIRCIAYWQSVRSNYYQEEMQAQGYYLCVADRDTRLWAQETRIHFFSCGSSSYVCLVHVLLYFRLQQQQAPPSCCCYIQSSITSHRISGAAAARQTESYGAGRPQTNFLAGAAFPPLCWPRRRRLHGVGTTSS
jgi:hypothetical protein